MTDRIAKKPLHKFGYDFIPAEYLPEGQDEFYIRDEQLGKTDQYRELTAYEIEVLVKNDNQAGSWTDIMVSEKFNPSLVKNCQFFGRIRIGALQPFFLEYHELKLPVGLYNSTIVSCDIGDNSVIKNVDYLSHYIIGKEVVLFNINEMHCTSHAKFGNGIVKQGESEAARIWLEICNENGGRRVIPFDGMITADAWLWSKFRDNKKLLDRFREMTEAEFDERRGHYGIIGDRCVIKNTRILKDVKVGTDAYIKGGNKLKNLTINSSRESPSQIGEGVEMVNGIMGFGSRSFYGVKAVRFVMGENTILKYGARLINSFLGDNSTISCCEVLNSLIFPAHEQHHNNSFLVAATVMGQSNIAAGATLGSNHNSRGADGEIVAGRGFWPGLSSNIKHNSRFASYCLLAKGSYASELDIPLPFSLVSNDEQENCLVVLPAYWWMYNMYALARNSWKYGDRDRRKHHIQPIVFEFLAPDTVAEVFQAMRLLETATAKAFLKQNPTFSPNGDGDLYTMGKELLLGDADALRDLKILGEAMENSKREVRIIKAFQAYQAYREMIHYYGVKTILDYGLHNLDHLRALSAQKGIQREKWFNLGGQLLPQSELDMLLANVKSRKINSWDALHDRYHQIHQRYDQFNAAYAYSSLLELHEITEAALNPDLWNQWLKQAVETGHKIASLTRKSREKDYTNPYRKMVYDNQDEMDAVLGSMNENSFVKQMEEEARAFDQKVKGILIG